MSSEHWITESTDFPEFDHEEESSPWLNPEEEAHLSSMSKSSSHSLTTSSSSRSSSDAPTHSSHSSSLEQVQDKRNAFKRRGDYSFRSGNFEKAVRRYSRALELDPTNFILLSNRSAAHLAQGHALEAVEDAMACIETQPQDCRGYLRLAVAFQKMEQWQNAKQSFLQVLEIDATNTVAHKGIELCNEKIAQEEEEEELQQQEEQVGQSQSPPKEASVVTEETHSSTEDTPSPPSQRPSTGMSELSKQLRQMQSKIETQSSEMERLQRQLCIMGQVKGVDPEEVEWELHQACQAESHAELQRRICLLQNQLETLTTLQSTEVNRAYFNPSRAIANLQLRVGELEEVETVLRNEIADLYTSLQTETLKSQKLNATCHAQKKQLVELLKHVTLQTSSHHADGSQKFSVQVLATGTNQHQHVNTNTNTNTELEERLRDAELQLNMERDKAKLLEIQVEAREVEAQLHRQQYQSKLKFQQDFIETLERQLLATHEKEDNHDEKENGGLLMKEQQQQRSTMMQEPTTTKHQSMSLGRSSEPRTTTSRTLLGNKSEPHMRTNTTPPLLPSTTPNNKPTMMEAQKICSGFLLKRDRHLLSKGSWKKRYFCLYRSFGTYQLTFGDLQNVKGTISNITTGVSTVEQVHDKKQAYCFCLQVNPSDAKAQVLVVAAASQAELTKWLTALTNATTGRGRSNTTRSSQDNQEDDNDFEMVGRMKKLDHLLTKYNYP